MTSHSSLNPQNPALVLSGLCVVRAMCRARTLHAALSASSQDAEGECCLLLLSIRPICAA